MKKRSIWLTAALLVGLAACSRTAVEVTPTPQPIAQPTERITAAPTPAASAPAPSAVTTPASTPTAAEESPEPVLTPSPIPTSLPTPSPAPTQTPVAVSSQAPVPTQAATPTPAPVPEPTPTPAAEPTPEVVATPEPLPTANPARPSDEEVLAAFRKAWEAYNWFDLYALEGHQDEKKELDGMVYSRVADERFPNMDSFRSYLKTLFSDEVVDGLLPIGGQQYVEIDGQLYTSEGGRGTDITKGAVTLSVLWPQEEEPLTCTVRAEVELLDEETLSTVVGSELHEFPYQKVGEKWVFTHFETIK